MAAPSGKFYPVGLQRVRVYQLNSNGIPTGGVASVGGYEGLIFEGSRAFELTIPDVRRIVHVGDNAIKATDMLPRIEAATGTLTVGGQYGDIIALLSGTKSATVGEAKVLGYSTSQQGLDPVVGLLMYQQAKEASTGTRVWRAYHIMSTQAIVAPTSMAQEAQDVKFSLLPSAVTHHLWGATFTANVEGYTSAEIVETVTYNLPHVVAWQGDGSNTEFLFPTDKPAVSTAKIHAVYTTTSTGTITNVTSTATLAVDKITITGAPAATVCITCFYEYAAA
jgi:hypothetical protein